ncbi:hypothetical protein BMF89_14320 [Arthrobacter sp. SRS-W-1-2016]|uniref:glycosyltransferase family 2 protein n=1 Tax=Arthrobacter sp. SRS-W-1-2016 TaxID=1930254 RepID=UPI0009D188BD|nr:glycosyltransferase family 2 protein [Arthrobacter sp. SRS-W-1-2016]OOP61071.1 hypothetical protein BMF89_14320 [Arthrobacter sp. SRS-W-1-2016]
MGKSSAVAGIVTFNPDLGRLRENLTAAFHEVGEIVIIDNNSENLGSIESLRDEFPGLYILANTSNGGIATALNQVMAWAAKRGMAWALLLDQDSVVARGMVDSLARSIDAEVGVVCPSIVDRSDPSPVIESGPPVDVDYCITSGSLCSVKAWKSVDGYDEAMFIDFVDFDFCLRLREAGFRIIREPGSTLLHEIGQITRHGPMTAYHHSAFRSYHMARDMLYYAHKHRSSPRELMVHQRRLAGTYAVLFRKAIVVSLFEEDRLRRVTSIIRGVFSGTIALRRVA